MRPGPAWLAAAAALTGCAPRPVPEAPVTLARQDYLLHCMGCHGEDGKGLGAQVPNLRTDLGRIAGLPGGRAYLLRVPGVSQSNLPSGQLAQVLNYAISEFGGAEVARRIPPFTAEEIERARANPLLEITASRAEVLRTAGR